MDAPVTQVTSGKPRSRIRVQNFVAVEGLSQQRKAMTRAMRQDCKIDVQPSEPLFFSLFGLQLYQARTFVLTMACLLTRLPMPTGLCASAPTCPHA